MSHRFSLKKAAGSRNVCYYCPGDAGNTNVKVALRVPNKMIYVLLVANDTGIPHILIYHCQKESADVYFLQEQLNRALGS